MVVNLSVNYDLCEELPFVSFEIVCFIGLSLDSGVIKEEETEPPSLFRTDPNQGRSCHDFHAKHVHPYPFLLTFAESSPAG